MSTELAPQQKSSNEIVLNSSGKTISPEDLSTEGLAAVAMVLRARETRPPTARDLMEQAWHTNPASAESTVARPVLHADIELQSHQYKRVA